VLVSRLWQEQKLAFPIDGHKKGAYWLTYFRLDSSKLTEYNRELRINETVVRSLTLKVEPRLVEALVESFGLRRGKPAPIWERTSLLQSGCEGRRSSGQLRQINYRVQRNAKP
jgi:small subunit ribosomal protein S6